MNRPIRRVAVLAGLMFFALLLNASYLVVFRDASLDADPRNRRTRDAEFAMQRGAILVGNTPIAQTTPNEGRFKFKRTYADGPLWAPVTGYYSYDYAQTGLESSYNTQLSGTDDSQFFGRVMDTLTSEQPVGASLQTTLDSRAQRAASDALGNRTGAVVALDYRTGAVKALVSKPSYDPNALASTDLAAAREAWTELNSDTSRPLTNRATKEVYPPGSTFKLVTAAAALEDGMAPDTSVDSPASLTLPLSNTKLTNEVNCGGATTTLDRALQTSCNTAFANIGLDLGDEKLREQAQKFGFDSALEGDLSPAVSRFPESPDQPQLAMSSIGQFDVAASPLQMAVVAGAIANDGQVMQPYLVQDVRNPDLSRLSSNDGKKLERAMKADNAQALQQMMVNVVEQGTGSRAGVPGTRVGGKTGTAQTSPERPPYAWFIGFAEDPDVAIAVFIEDAQVQRSDIAGGRLAGPVFKAVVEALK
ncbi:peptidoglycan D,D-transpeptidase FtsI family protein [Luteococcus sp. Sow4_B9]|uniref:peptidoglycan D,D-transpeptidase FtsI family protein n=1 Tax=Luteococcus sp. Sow4_B9 TaxID=3438792 RepID=UPI003F98ACA2